MNAQTFLEAHWPARGHYCIAVPTKWVEDGKERKSYKHYICDDIDDAVAQFELLRPTHDVYFAVNTLKQALKKGARTHENMGFARCLFLDLDVGTDKPAKKFASQQEALIALDGFRQLLKLPMPTLVSSGYGVHCYWPFEQEMTVGKWRHYSNLFYRLILHYNFKADLSRIKDESSVLRIPGGFNFKNKANPKRVTVRHTAEPIDTDELWEILIDACEAAGISTDTAQRIVVNSAQACEGVGNLAGGDDFQGRVPTYEQVRASCAQLQFIENNGGDLEYTHWHKALGLIRRCSDGRDHAHRLSIKNYDNYSADEVDRKLDEQEALGIGPTTCAVMDQVSGNNICKKCSCWQRTISPINAPFIPKVLLADALPKPQKQITAAERYTWTPPPLPLGYQWVTREKDKATILGVAILTEKEEKEVLVQFLDYLLFPISRQMNNVGNGDQHIWCAHVPHEDPKTFVIPSGAISDRKELLRILNDHGIYINLRHFDMVQTYMSAYIKRLQRDCKPEAKHQHFGWVDGNKAFIIGDHKLLKGGKTEPVQVTGAAAELLEDFTLRRSGSLELQIEAMKHFTRHDAPREQFYILCSLASPLLHMLDNYYGCTINATGPTGGGKTGLMFAGMSFWGNPRDCYLSGVKNQGATALARVTALFAMHSLPLALDEISGIEPEDARSFTYAATQCKGRTRGSRSGGFQKSSTGGASKDNDDFRANFVLSTSNGSLHSRLSEGSVVGSATSARVIELDFPKLTPDVKVDGDEMMALILENYGHIGEVFIRYVIDNHAEVKSQVREKAKEIDRVFGVKLAERFLSSVAPCVFIASQIARSLGLLDFNEERILQWLMVEHLQRIRGVIDMEYVSPINGLTDCIDETIHAMVIADKFHGKILEPHIPKFQAVKGRYDKHTRTMYIATEALHTYFGRKRLPRGEYLNQLTESKVVLGIERVTLAKGTDFAGGRTACYVIDMNHEEMRDTCEAVGAEEVMRLKVVVDNTKPRAGAPKLDPEAIKRLQQDDDDA